MVWIIVWAGLLIVVLYSPIGSPDFYSSPDYRVESRQVAFKSEATLNAPKQSSATVNEGDGLIIPDINTGLTSKYSVGSYRQSKTSLNGSSYGSNESSSNGKYNSGLGRSGDGGISMIAARGSRNSTGSSEIVMTNGITTMSLTSTGNNSSTRQSVKAVEPQTGGTDPGGDPDGPAIPVGDGWGLFILFGAVYVIFKKKNLFLKDRNASH